MKVLWWRARYALWMWRLACRWWEVSFAIHAARAAEYMTGCWYEEPEDAVRIEISYMADG